MKKQLVLCSLILLSASMFHGCTPSEPPVQPKEALKEQIEPPAPKDEKLPQRAVQAALSGEALFKEHCKACHRNGGNMINPEKTLQGHVLESYNIRTPEDIVAIMRNPGKGMPKYGEDKIPDKEAREIGEYILQTFR